MSIDPSVDTKMTEPQKRVYLLDQYRKLKTDPKAIIFCPWCSKISKAPEHGHEEIACCGVFAMEWAQIGIDMLKSVERQMAATSTGKMDVINCPYCLTSLKKWTADPTTWIHPNVSPWCCEQLHDAVLALAQGYETQLRIDNFKRIQDGWDKAQAKAGRN